MVKLAFILGLGRIFATWGLMGAMQFFLFVYIFWSISALIFFLNVSILSCLLTLIQMERLFHILSCNIFRKMKILIWAWTILLCSPGWPDCRLLQILARLLSIYLFIQNLGQQQRNVRMKGVCKCWIQCYNV